MRKKYENMKFESIRAKNEYCTPKRASYCAIYLEDCVRSFYICFFFITKVCR